MRDEAVYVSRARIGYLCPFQTPPPQQLTKYQIDIFGRLLVNLQQRRARRNGFALDSGISRGISGNC
jgi:hypothetical protein